MTASLGRRAHRTLATATVLAVVLGGAVLIVRGRREKARSPSPPVPDARDSILESGPAGAAAPPAREAIFETAVASEPAPEDREASEARGALEVRVVDPWDRLVEFAEIRARRLDVPNAEPVLPSRGEGTFDLPLGVPHRIDVATHLCFEPAVREPVYANSEVITVQLVSRCARISGRVVDAETSETLPDAQVAWRTEGGASAATGALGGFDLLVPAGALRLSMGAADYEPAIREFRLAAGAWLRGVGSRLRRRIRSGVEVRVLDPEGGPVVGAKATFGAVAEVPAESSSSEGLRSLPERVSDSSGSFRVSLPARRTVLHQRPSGSISIAEVY